MEACAQGSSTFAPDKVQNDTAPPGAAARDAAQAFRRRTKMQAAARGVAETTSPRRERHGGSAHGLWWFRFINNKQATASGGNGGEAGEVRGTKRERGRREGGRDGGEGWNRRNGRRNGWVGTERLMLVLFRALVLVWALAPHPWHDGAKGQRGQKTFMAPTMARARGTRMMTTARRWLLRDGASRPRGGRPE